MFRYLCKKINKKTYEKNPAVLRPLRLFPGERQANREDIWQQHILEETQEVQNCISSMCECPPECHGGDGLTGIYKTLLL